jgi:hypothetical protein
MPWLSPVCGGENMSSITDQVAVNRELIEKMRFTLTEIIYDVEELTDDNEDYRDVSDALDYSIEVCDTLIEELNNVLTLIDYAEEERE